jgi:cell division protein FtsI/penicillin-binding protein 2
MPPASRTTVYSRRRRAAALGALTLTLLALAAAALLLTRGGGGPGAQDVAADFLAAWTRGDDRGAAGLTNAPPRALSALQANRRGLDGATVQARLADAHEDGDAASARFTVTWNVPGTGRWAYRSALRLRRTDDVWRVTWAPEVVHPALRGQNRLGTTRTHAARGRILARDGRAIVRARPVYRIGLARDKVRDIRASAEALAAVVDVSARELRNALRGAGPQQFVEAVTVRKADYEKLRTDLASVPGALAVPGEAPLAESRGFARALLGTVGPATAEQLGKLGDDRGPGDLVGQSGLQARYEDRLGGSPTRQIVIRNADGAPVRTLLERGGRPGRSLRTTLDLDVQRAAETALGDRDDAASLVAVQPSTGDILAVANRPSDGGVDSALEGRYPPGSTFKVVTTAALLRAGLRPDEIVDCPATTNVGGRTFKNFEGNAQGAVPFSEDFAQSCNTAFVSLTDRLDPEALTEAGRAFGLGEPLKLGMPAADSAVPAGDDLVARAASMIGQAKILASPLSMAGVAATVAAGRWHAPRLLSGDPHRAGAPLAAPELATLRDLTRRVVTSGTGTALAGVPGDVHGKSGTAEYGGGDPPPTHAWFIAYRGDLAIAVLVENGRSGGTVAAPIAARFFSALP